MDTMRILISSWCSPLGDEVTKGRGFLTSSPHSEHHEESHGVHENLVLHFISNPPPSWTSSPHGEYHEVSHGVHVNLVMNLFPPPLLILVTSR